MKLFGKEIDFKSLDFKSLDFKSFTKKENLKYLGLIFIVAMVVYLLVFAPDMSSHIKKVRFAENLITSVHQ